MDTDQRSPLRRLRPVTLALQLVTAGGLAVDARIHLRLAGAYDAVRTHTLSQGDLFRVEAGAAILAGVLVLVLRRSWVGLLAAAVALGGLGAILLYRYVDVGSVGPLPSMYEPAWYPDKTNSAIAQAVAGVAALVLAVILRPGARGRSARTSADRAESPSA